MPRSVPAATFLLTLICNHLSGGRWPSIDEGQIEACTDVEKQQSVIKRALPRDIVGKSVQSDKASKSTETSDILETVRKAGHCVILDAVRIGKIVARTILFLLYLR
jgi:hypothetical protein